MSPTISYVLGDKWAADFKERHNKSHWLLIGSPNVQVDSIY